MIKGRIAIAFAVGLFATNACTDQDAASTAADDHAAAAPNILVIIADDTGVEQYASFDIGAHPANTPNIDALAARGISFRNVWSAPMCSPTRATLLTGRYGFRTGVGAGVSSKSIDGYPDAPPEVAGAPDEIYEDVGSVYKKFEDFSNTDLGPWLNSGPRSSEKGLPALLKNSAANYRTAAFGKWHLGDRDNGWLMHPANIGFERFSLLMKNQPESYFSWWENVDGEMTHRTGYTATQKIDDALDWLQSDAGTPWFLWLSFNLPHYPLHVPPGVEADAEALAEDPHALLDVMIEYMDAEIGRLLDGIGEANLDNTIVMFIGDNGTTPSAIDPPFGPTRAKFSLYEGGVRVPLIFAGPGLPGGASSDAMVNTVDIYATLLDLAGLDAPAEPISDSISLTPYFADPSLPSVRSFQYTEMFTTGQGIEGGGFAIRDERHKFVTNQVMTELYDLDEDPWEKNNLLADDASDEVLRIAERLRAQAKALHASDEP